MEPTIAKDNTNAMAQMEFNYADNNNRNGSGESNLVGGRDGMDESVGGKSITEILGVSGPNGAGGSTKPTS